MLQMQKSGGSEREDVQNGATGSILLQDKNNRADSSCEETRETLGWKGESMQQTDINKENEMNRIPASMKPLGNEIKSPKIVRTTLASPSTASIEERSGTVPKLSPSNGAVRSEHRVVSHSKPLSKPLVLATRVTQVHLSPPPPETSERNEVSWQEIDDDYVVVAPVVSRLKAMFEVSDAKLEKVAEKVSPRGPLQQRFGNVKSPRKVRSAAEQQEQVSVTKSDIQDASGFDSSTAPTGEIDTYAQIIMFLCGSLTIGEHRH